MELVENLERVVDPILKGYSTSAETQGIIDQE